VRWCGLDLSGTGYGPVEDSYDLGSELSGSVKAGNLLTCTVTNSFLRRIYVSSFDKNVNVHVV
jgi:hypothetical protein